MSTEVMMPASGMNQDTGKLIEWLVNEGQGVFFFDRFEGKKLTKNLLETKITNKYIY